MRWWRMNVSGDRDGEVWCIVVAAGAGRRFGAPKQHVELAGVTVLGRSLVSALSACDGVVVCLAPDDPLLDAASMPDGVVVVEGGASRSRSVANGLEAVPDAATVVLVHDAARPLASPDLFRRVVAAVRAGADAVVPAVPVIDTIRELDGGTLDRDRLRAVQTPQGFAATVLRSAYRRGGEATDDASLVEASGGTVVLIKGERANLKITEPIDLDVAAALAERLTAPVHDGGSDT